MKNRAFVFGLALVLLVGFAVGCGGEKSAEEVNTDKKPVAEKKLPTLPLEGFVGQMNEVDGTFVIATLPEKEGQKPGEMKVLISESTEIMNLDGQSATIKNYDRVRIDIGEVSESEIAAERITITKASEKVTFTDDSTSDVDTLSADYDSVPVILKSSTADFPKSFPDGTWTVKVPESHPTIQAAKIIELVSGDWSIYLIENPETEEKFSVTVTDRAKFEWTGIITNDNKVEPR